jgi:energy-coupling factor transporter ATP-binding protein EcfA2
MSEEDIIKDKITYIGNVDYRNKAVTFGIKEDDRTRHTYIIGKTGMGKSTLLENLAIQDINNGEGICVIDPHGSMAEKLLDYIPEHRIKDVVYFAPFDGEYPVGLNMLEKVSAEKRYLLANGMMSAFKKIFTDGDGKGTFSARMEYVLNNIILALLENEGQTLLGVNRMLFDKDYRKFIVSNVTDPTVRDFWVNEYTSYTDKTAQELAPSIQNKIGQFISNPLIRNIIGQKKTSFDVRKLMDEKKIFIVNLSKGKVGEGNANLLGSLLITKIYLAAMSRADVGPYAMKELPPFYFYVDEFQNFANESFASILSEARKYKLALTVAHQYVEQMTDEVKAAVFGNVGTMITFRVGATDAEVFEKEFAPYFILDDFVNLSAFQIYIRLMIDGQGSKPFSAKTLPTIQRPPQSYADAIIANSRLVNGKPKHLVEEEINEFYKPTPKPVVAKKAENSEGEKEIIVREIRNDTPLPNKIVPRVETKNKEHDVQYKREERQVNNERLPDTSRHEKRSENRSESKGGRVDNRIDKRRTVVDQAGKNIDVVQFDNAPALSLKDALAKALKEAEDLKKDVSTIVSNEGPPDKKSKQEVSEDVLRKLLED